ncbi:MAG: hypothetical protein EXS03_03015 [Phycisphaerales bacterium]|nr:hypothetical protein [Phycisphaerales bacterium]
MIDSKNTELPTIPLGTAPEYLAGGGGGGSTGSSRGGGGGGVGGVFRGGGGGITNKLRPVKRSREVFIRS